jgi:hypothetical protein
VRTRRSTTNVNSITPKTGSNGAAAARPQSWRDTGPYSARNSSKGALIDEAGRVFTAIAGGESVETVRDQVLHGVLLPQRSRENRERIWSSIHTRYLISSAPWLTSRLADTSKEGPHSPEFVSHLYLLYALRDRLTFDFVTCVLWPKGHQTRPVISRNQLLDLLKDAAERQPQIERWAESTRIKLAGSILTALRDFGMLEGHQKKVLTRPILPLTTAETLVRILTSEGCRGRQLLQDRTWHLFLLTEPEVSSVLARLAQEGRIHFEKVGSTVVLETPSDWEERL